MLFGYIRDSRDWVPVIFLILGAIAGVTILVKLWLANHRKQMNSKDVVNDIKGWAAVMGCLMFLTIFFALANSTRHDYLDLYEIGCVYEENGDYESAYDTFVDLERLTDGYKDVAQRIRKLYPIVQYEHGLEAMESVDYYHAYKFFDSAGEYLDSRYLAEYCYFNYLRAIHPEWVGD